MIHIKAKVATRENINVNVSEPENISAEVDSINFAGVRSINGMTGDVEIPSADAYTKEETNALLAEKANSSDLSRVATTGNYNDLSNKPTIPTVPTKVSAFQNDAGYITEAPVRSVNGQTGDVVIPAVDAYTKQETNTLLSAKANDADLARVAKSGNYNDLSNKPTIPTVPTNVSAFQNDAGYATEQWVGAQGYLTAAPVTSVNGKTGAVQVVEGLAPLIGLAQQITPAQVAQAVQEGRTAVISYYHEAFGLLTFNFFIYSQAKDMVFATATFNYNGTMLTTLIGGDLELNEWYFEYAALAYEEDIPTKVSDLQNDSGFLTQQSLNGYATQTWVNQQIPTVPTNVSAFTNDAGYLTLADLPIYSGGVE